MRSGSAQPGGQLLAQPDSSQQPVQLPLQLAESLRHTEGLIASMAASAMVANLSGLSEKKKIVRSGEQEHAKICIWRLEGSVTL